VTTASLAAASKAVVPLIYRHGRRLVVGAPTTAIVWDGDTALFALGDGSVRAAGMTGDPAAHTLHRGAILCAVAGVAGGIVTGGDDGQVITMAPDGTTAAIGNFGSRWVEQLVASPASKLIVAGVGKEAIVWMPGAVVPSHRFAFKSTVAGLSLDAMGKRLAVAHYNGASLLYPVSPGSSRNVLQWVGSHISCTLHPNAEYLITGTQETGLHGWRLPQGNDMTMSGYRAKTRSFSWNRKAKWLATSGDGRVVIWPFDGRNGPMGRAPLLAGDRGALVTKVAFHPREAVLAVGYGDGAVTLVRIDDDQQTLVDEPGGGAISALAWNTAGTLLAYGDEDGRAGILDLTKRA
jgi:WD40 repeat protein